MYYLQDHNKHSQTACCTIKRGWERLVSNTETLASCDGKRNGKDCHEDGNIHLVLKYLNLPGVFCDSCAADLLNAGLAERGEGGWEGRKTAWPLRPNRNQRQRHLKIITATKNIRFALTAILRVSIAMSMS